MSHGDHVPRIYYDYTALALCDNQTREKKSFPEKNKIIGYLDKIKNTTQKKSLSIYNNKSGIYLKKLNFMPDSKLNEINAASYIYCSLTNCLPKNNFGIALNNNGNLLVIKGESHNLIKGIYNKYTNGYHYEIANLTSGEDEIKFNHLYINHYGILTGEEQQTNEHYCISIDKISSSLETSEQSVILHLNKHKKNYPMKN